MTSVLIKRKSRTVSISRMVKTVIFTKDKKKLMTEITLREGSLETISFTFKLNGAPYNIGTKAVRMRRHDWEGVDDLFSSTDIPPLLSVTDPDEGIVTFTPEADTWKYDPNERSVYRIYLEIEESEGVWKVWPEATNLSIEIVPEWGK